MANALYSKYKELLLTSAAPDLTSTNIKVVLLNSTYTADTHTDDYLDDIPGGAIVATSGNLTGKSVSTGCFDAADVTFPTVASGSTVTQFVGYYDSGSSSTSLLLFFEDTATGLSLSTNGSDIFLIWSNSGDKIFRL